MEHIPAFAGFAQGRSGINAGPARRFCVYAELLAGISQAKAELCGGINKKNNDLVILSASCL